MQRCFHKSFPRDVNYPAMSVRKETRILWSFASPTVSDLFLGPLVRETFFFCQWELYKETRADKESFWVQPTIPRRRATFQDKKVEMNENANGLQHGTYWQACLSRSKGLVGVAVLQWQVGKRAWACLLWEGGKSEPSIPVDCLQCNL